LPPGVLRKKKCADSRYVPQRNQLSYRTFKVFTPELVKPGRPSMASVAKGSKVEWKWGANKAEGKVAEKFTKPVKRTIKGKTVKRNASKEEPAYLVKQEDGGRVLKSGSELHKA
jgi:hypothetical protein